MQDLRPGPMPGDLPQQPHPDTLIHVAGAQRAGAADATDQNRDSDGAVRQVGQAGPLVNTRASDQGRWTESEYVDRHVS